MFHFILTPILAQEKNTYSLEEARKEALENSAEVKKAELDVQKASYRAWETKAIGLPQINAEGNFQQFIDIPTQVIPANAFNPAAPPDELIGVQFGTEYSMSANLTVSQLLFDGRYLIGLQAIDLLERIQDQNLERTEKIAREEVEGAYYMVAAAAEQVKVTEMAKVKLEKLANDMQELADLKMVEQTEADQMALNLARLENNLTMAKRQHQLAIGLLTLKMGYGLDREVNISDSLWSLVEAFDPETYSDQNYAPSSAIEVQMLETQLVLDSLNVKNEKAAGMPSLAAFFQTQQQAFRNEFDFLQNKPWYPANIWGVSLTVPIFSSGQRNAKVKQAKIMQEQTEITIGSVKEGLELQMQNARVQLKTANDVMKTNLKSLNIAETILNNATEKNKLGAISAMELTQIHNQYIQTYSEYINSAYQVLQAKLELDKLLINE